MKDLKQLKTLNTIADTDWVVVLVGKNKEPYKISKANLVSFLQTNQAAANTIYTADGILTGDRVIDGGTNSISMININEFYAKGDTSATLESDGDLNLAGSRILFNGFNSLVTEKVTLTTAEVQTLSSVGYEVSGGVPGKIKVLVDAAIAYNYSGAAFATGGDIRLIENGFGNAISVDLPAASLYNITSKYYMLPAIGTATEISAGDKIKLIAAADFTNGGTSELVVYITYRLLDA